MSGNRNWPSFGGLTQAEAQQAFETALSELSIRFQKNGSLVSVVEDTATPSNNAPLPVKLSGVTGDVNITAGDLNVQLSHLGASHDSVRIGNGTTLLGLTGDGEAMVRDADAVAALETIEAALAGTLRVQLPDALTQTSTGALAGVGQHIQLETNGASQFCFKPSGTWSGHLTLAGSMLASTDPGFNDSFQLIPIFDYISQTIQNTCAHNGTHTGQVGGFRYIRVTMIIHDSGTANVSAWMNAGDGPSIVTSPASGGFYARATMRYMRDGAETFVGRDTVTPANSRGMPVEILKPDGTIVDLSALSTGAATEAKQTEQVTALEEIKTAIESNVGLKVSSGTYTFTGLGNEVILPTEGAASFTLSPSFAWSGSVNVSASNDGITFASLPLYSFGAGEFTDTITAATTGHGSIAGFKFVKLILTGLTSGTGVANWAMSHSGGAPIMIGTSGPNQLTGRMWLSDGNGNIVNSSSGMLLTSAAPTTPIVKTVKSAQVTVGTTAVRATHDASAPSSGRAKLRIKASADNANNIFIGASSVTTSNGWRLLPGEEASFDFDAGDYYLISNGSGQIAFILEQE